MSHALASPSSAHRWIACPNSIAMERDQPEGDTTAADLGTDKHELLTICLRSGDSAKAHLGREMGKGNVVDREFANHVQAVIDEVRGIKNGYEYLGYRVDLKVDQKVPISQITGEEEATGTLDVALAVRDKLTGSLIQLYIIDAKFGYLTVDAAYNPQMEMYAHGFSTDLEYSYESYTVCILIIAQPTTVYSTWKTTLGEIDSWRKAIVTPAARRALEIYHSKEPLKPENFNVTKKGCQFCKAKAVCPAMAEYAEESMKMNAESTDRLGEAFKRAEIVELWVKAVRERAAYELNQGNQVPGLKLVQGRAGNRAWSSESEAEALMKKFKMKKEEMYNMKLLGPAPVLNFLKSQPRRLKKIEQLVSRTKGSLKVVLESEPGEPVSVSRPEDGFYAE